jgi:hypothetical protein
MGKEFHLPSIDQSLKNYYLGWLEKAKQQRPNEPSLVYKYWFLTLQKTSHSQEREKLLNGFIEKKHIIELVSTESLSKILCRLEFDKKPDDEFIRILYYHYLLITIFSEEKTRLENFPIEFICRSVEMMDVDTFKNYLNMESIEIVFIHLLPDKLKEISESAKHKTIDTNIVNFFDEDLFSGIQLNTRK